MSPIRSVLLLVSTAFLPACEAGTSLGPTHVTFEVEGRTIHDPIVNGSYRPADERWEMSSHGPFAVSIRIESLPVTGAHSFGGGVAATLITPDGQFAAVSGRLTFDGPAICKSERALYGPDGSVTYCRYEGSFAFTATDGAGRRRAVTDGRFVVNVRKVAD